jgi:hypothetical protein
LTRGHWGGRGLGRLRLHEREATRALWRGHFEAWRRSGLTQREYCERHGLSLKSFGNWRGQLKREDAAGSNARWGRHPRLRHMVSPRANPVANEAADRVPPVVTRPGRRRQRTSDTSSRRPVYPASQTYLLMLLYFRITRREREKGALPGAGAAVSAGDQSGC